VKRLRHKTYAQASFSNYGSKFAVECLKWNIRFVSDTVDAWRLKWEDRLCQYCLLHSRYTPVSDNPPNLPKSAIAECIILFRFLGDKRTSAKFEYDIVKRLQ
jgi:hypothetical protein